MNRLLLNPYFWVLLVPLVAFLTAVYFKVEPDYLNIGGRTVVFGLLAYIAVRYVGTAPILAWRGDWSDAARNVIGWGTSISAMMFQQVYSALYLIMDRPLWLSSQYWGPSFVVLMCVGLALVVSSVPRFWPFGGPGSGMGATASLVVGLLGAAGLFFVQQLPMVWKALVAIFAEIAPRAF
jgi:hypothetical protein